MFKNKKTAAAINPDSTDTLIGEGSVFEGRIKSAAGLRIEGSIIGDVESSGDVTIGEKGVVKSNITARNVIIAGKVTGNVTVKEKLTIVSTGTLTGNSSASAFVIEEGGVFSGSSKMEGKAVTEKSAQTRSDSGPSADNQGNFKSGLQKPFGDSAAM